MGTEMADWLRAIKNKVTREVISRKLISGEPIDKSVTPISRCLIDQYVERPISSFLSGGAQQSGQGSVVPLDYAAGVMVIRGGGLEVYP